MWQIIVGIVRYEAYCPFEFCWKNQIAFVTSLLLIYKGFKPYWQIYSVQISLNALLYFIIQSGIFSHCTDTLGF